MTRPSVQPLNNPGSGNRPFNPTLKSLARRVIVLTG